MDSLYATSHCKVSPRNATDNTLCMSEGSQSPSLLYQYRQSILMKERMEQDAQAAQAAQAAQEQEKLAQARLLQEEYEETERERKKHQDRRALELLKHKLRQQQQQQQGDSALRTTTCSMPLSPSSYSLPVTPTESTSLIPTIIQEVGITLDKEPVSHYVSSHSQQQQQQEEHEEEVQVEAKSTPHLTEEKDSLEPAVPLLKPTHEIFFSGDGKVIYFNGQGTRNSFDDDDEEEDHGDSSSEDEEEEEEEKWQTSHDIPAVEQCDIVQLGYQLGKMDIDDVHSTESKDALSRSPVSMCSRSSQKRHIDQISAKSDSDEMEDADDCVGFQSQRKRIKKEPAKPLAITVKDAKSKLLALPSLTTPTLPATISKSSSLERSGITVKKFVPVTGHASASSTSDIVIVKQAHKAVLSNWTNHKQEQTVKKKNDMDMQIGMVIVVTYLKILSTFYPNY